MTVAGSKTKTMQHAIQDTVSEVPFHLLPRTACLLTCTVPAGFPSPAADDMEEPIDLGA